MSNPYDCGICHNEGYDHADDCPFNPANLKEEAMTNKTLCKGSGKTADTLEHRRTSGSTFVKCPDCTRILKPTPASGLLREHQPRNKSTASLDNTRDSLWAYAVSTERQGHFALGLQVQVRFGAKPCGWDQGDDEPFVGNRYDGWDDDDYDRWHKIEAVSDDGQSFSAGGWFWEPEDLVVPR